MRIQRNLLLQWMGECHQRKRNVLRCPWVLLFAKAEECAPLTQQYFIVNVAVSCRCVQIDECTDSCGSSDLQ